MNIKIKTTNLILNEEAAVRVNKSLSKLDRVVGDDTAVQCDVELARTTEHHQKGDIFRAEIHLSGGGLDEYAAMEQEDLMSAVTYVRDELVHKLRGKKARRMSYFRRSGARMKAMMKGILPWGEEGWYRRNR